MQEKKTLDENSKRLVDINATKGKNSRMQIMCKNGYKLWHKICYPEYISMNAKEYLVVSF